MNFIKRLVCQVELFSLPLRQISCLSVVNKLPVQVKKPCVLVNYEQTREYKVKTRLRKRCKSCFFVWRNGRLYVECKEHPRHKQHHVSSLLKGYDNIPHGYHIPNVK